MQYQLTPKEKTALKAYIKRRLEDIQWEASMLDNYLPYYLKEPERLKQINKKIDKLNAKQILSLNKWQISCLHSSDMNKVAELAEFYDFLDMEYKTLYPQ